MSIFEVPIPDIDSDTDDEQLDNSQLITNYSEEFSGVIEAKQLIIGISDTTYLIRSLFNLNKNVAVFSHQSEKKTENKEEEKGDCRIYTNENKETIIVCCTMNFNSNIHQNTKNALDSQFMKILTKKIFEKIKVKTVIVLDTFLSSSYYQVDSNDLEMKISPPFLRKLATTSHKKICDCKFMETPNTIDGLSAAILSYCEMSGIEGHVYVSVKESIFGKNTTNLRTMEAFAPIVKYFQNEKDFQKDLRNYQEQDQSSLFRKAYDLIPKQLSQPNPLFM